MTVHLGELTSALVDGQLDHRTRDWALAHIAHCGACRSEVDWQRRLKARVTRLDGPGLPADLADRLSHLALSPEFAAPPARERGPERRFPSFSGFPVAAFTGASAGPRRQHTRPHLVVPRGSRTRRVLAGGVFMLAVGSGGAIALGGGSPASSGPAVTPAVETFVVEHGRTNTGWSVNEPALTLVSASFGG